MIVAERADNRVRSVSRRREAPGRALPFAVGVALAALAPLGPVHAQRVTAAPPAPAARSAEPAARHGASDTSLAAIVARLSEDAGYFDTDNLISNEASYLHVIPRLRAMGVRGGAYLGVGPDQNYSYIAAIRPRIAYLVDVRRDNLLQHLMFKALFARSANRARFLCLWLGRSCPRDADTWGDRSIESIVSALEGAPGNEAASRQLQADLVRDAAATGIPLSAADRATIQRFAATFQREGLALRFTSFGRPPRAYYPTLRDLILARDTEGARTSYLASEEAWRYVKAMHDSDRIIPVVGNLGGTRALPAIARDVAARGERVTALYTSNVEFYLWGDATFETFASHVASLPHEPNAVIIRSYFGRNFGDQHPLAVRGFASVQLLQPFDDFAQRHRRGGWPSYRALVTDGAR